MKKVISIIFFAAIGLCQTSAQTFRVRTATVFMADNYIFFDARSVQPMTDKSTELDLLVSGETAYLRLTPEFVKILKAQTKEGDELTRRLILEFDAEKVFWGGVFACPESGDCVVVCVLNKPRNPKKT